MLSHAFYVSTSTFGPHNFVDQDILRQARKNNPKLDVTGCLFRSPSCYAQILEGPYGSVEQIMGAIRVDPRHFDIVEWPPTNTTSRCFRDWSMGYAKSASADARLLAFGRAEPRQISEIADALKRIFETEYERVTG